MSEGDPPVGLDERGLCGPNLGLVCGHLGGTGGPAEVDTGFLENGDMPHDRNGVTVKQGQRVMLECAVKGVSPSEDACNVDLQVVGPETEYLPNITCNSKLVTVCPDAAESPEAPCTGPEPTTC